MLPLSISHHFNHLRIDWERKKVALVWREDEELIQSIKEPVFRVLLSPSDWVLFAKALTEGAPGTFRGGNWIIGSSITVKRKPPMGLSWRKVSVRKWALPFYFDFGRTLTMPGPFVAAIENVAEHLNELSESSES
jgi:hypothetical protein